jgi:hypothetical protein
MNFTSKFLNPVFCTGNLVFGLFCLLFHVHNVNSDICSFVINVAVVQVQHFYPIWMLVNGCPNVERGPMRTSATYLNGFEKDVSASFVAYWSDNLPLRVKVDFVILDFESLRQYLNRSALHLRRLFFIVFAIFTRYLGLFYFVLKLECMLLLLVRLKNLTYGKFLLLRHDTVLHEKVVMNDVKLSNFWSPSMLGYHDIILVKKCICVNNFSLKIYWLDLVDTAAHILKVACVEKTANY